MTLQGKAVLDSGFFICDHAVAGEIFTTPSVCGELLDIRSRGRFETLAAAGLKVVPPGAASRERVRRAAEESRDRSVLSETDRDVLALALDLGAVIHTDDFAIQNVAHLLGIPTEPLVQRRARYIRWVYRCSGCGRYFAHDGECPVCGSAIKRKLK